MDGQETSPAQISRVAITIPGKPFAWRRARSNGKFRFKDKATEAHRETLQAIVLRSIPTPMRGPLRVTVTAIFAIPKSWSKKDREAHLWRPHTQKPDLSNIIKEIEDGLNRIAWEDDSQIAAYEGCKKLWGDKDQTILIVERIGAA